MVSASRLMPATVPWNLAHNDTWFKWFPAWFFGLDHVTMIILEPKEVAA